MKQVATSEKVLVVDVVALYKYKSEVASLSHHYSSLGWNLFNIGFSNSGGERVSSAYSPFSFGHYLCLIDAKK